MGVPIVRHRFAGECLVSLFLFLASAPPSVAGELSADNPFGKPGLIVEHNVMVSMRDGVRLATDVYRPAQEGRYPVVLIRNPYDESQFDAVIGTWSNWVERGYVVVHQDVRGRYDSEGHYYPYFAEINDGYDTQQWAGRQPWSSGKVGTLGLSYLGSTQWLSAHLRAPPLTAMATAFTPFNYHKDVAFVGGAFQLASRVGFAVAMAGRVLQPRSNYDWNQIMGHLPLTTLDAAMGFDMPAFRHWIEHPSYDGYWRPLDVEARASEIDVPVLHIGGWYDVFLRSSYTAFNAVRHGSRGDKARQSQKLLIGPWRHTTDLQSKLGELDFGADAAVDWQALHMRWFDHWLKGEDTGLMNEPPVRYFVMGENRWRTAGEWPLKSTRFTEYYFSSRGNANGREGGGILSARRVAQGKASDTFVYDPKDPVPTRGGNQMSPVTTAGPFDQSDIETRKDVLVYTTAPLEEDVEVTGPLIVTLYAASSAKDTDFTAKLVDVHPDGKAYNLADGVIRARYRESFETAKLLEPGKVYEYKIDLWATSNLFRKGHRIRVDISSSNFPRFDRNPNTGHEFGVDSEGDLRMANQTIHHTAAFPSRITLPIIPRDRP